MHPESLGFPEQQKRLTKVPILPKQTTLLKQDTSLNSQKLKFKDKPVNTTNKETRQSNKSIDATKAWNLAPEIIKTCKKIWSAQKEIKKFVKTLPI